jgi:protein TonB
MKEPLSALAISNGRAVPFNRADRAAAMCSQARGEKPERRPTEGATVEIVDVVATVLGSSVEMQSERGVDGVYYGEPSLLWGQRGFILALVVMAHIGLAYLLYTYLGHRLTRVEIPPVVVTQIDQPRAVDRPTVTPPTLQRPQVYMPVPEFVPIQAPVQENAITVSTSLPDAQPSPAPAPHVIARTGASVDPRNPLHIGEEYYPEQSKRLGEEGACKVQLHVMANGSIDQAIIVKTSGFDRLDGACLKGVLGQRMLPATEDGRPVESTTVIRIHWDLRANR